MLTKILADFLFGLYLLCLLYHATNHIRTDIPTSVKNDLLNASSAPSNVKEGIINDIIKSGSTTPVKAGVSQGDELVKIVPYGENVSDFSPYWTTKAELNDLRAAGVSLEQKLGLPIGRHSPKYDVFEIKANQSSDVFRSKVASTVQNGYETTGGATQTLVLDRTKWSTPVKIDSFIP